MGLMQAHLDNTPLPRIGVSGDGELRQVLHRLDQICDNLPVKPFVSTPGIATHTILFARPQL